MFENVVSKPAGRRMKWIVGVSGVLHGCAVAAVVLASMWHVDKLSVARDHVSVAIAPSIPPGDSGGGKRKTLPKATTPQKIKVKGDVQPVHVSHEETTTTTSTDETTDTTATGNGGGGDGKGHDLVTLGGGCPPGMECSIGTATVDIKPPDAPKPCTDPSRAHDPDCAPQEVDIVEGLRISGETDIQPPDDVKSMMARDGQSKLHAKFRVCLDTDGNVTRTSQVRSTGYSTYDDELTAAMSTWRYKPYTAAGKPIAVCGAVIFNFTLR